MRRPVTRSFPTLLACGILVLGLVQVGAALAAGRLVESQLVESRVETVGRLGRANLAFLAAFLAVFAVGIALMALSGPLLAEWSGARPYRQLSDTAPWKWIGFLLGGFLLGYRAGGRGGAGGRG